MNGTKLVKLFRTVMFLCTVMTLVSGNVSAQPPLSKRDQRRVEKYERAQREAYEKRRQEALKHRYEIQTAEVQARMKETRKRSDQFTRRKREPFYKRWFNKLKRKKKHNQRKRRR